MSPTSALCVIAIVVSVVALLACAAMRRELTELNAFVRAGIGSKDRVERRLDLLPHKRARVILKFDPYCASCGPLVEHFVAAALQRPHGELTLVTSGRLPIRSDIGSTLHLADAQLFDRLRTPWVPALVAIDAVGTVLDAAACTGIDVIDSFIRTADERETLTESRTAS